MIHLVDTTNRRLYAEPLRRFHEERRLLFIQERGWRLNERDGGEYDDYDDEQALYLLSLDADDRLEAGCRLRPTVGGGVLPDLFPHLIADHEPSIRTAGVFECTRYLTTSHARGPAGFIARSKLHIAMIEAVQDQGGERLLGFVDLPLLTHLRRFSGLRIRPVGLPFDYEEGGTTIAFEIGVTAEDLAETRRKLAMPGRQLFSAPSWFPTGGDVVTLATASELLSDPHALSYDVRAVVIRFAKSRASIDVDALKARLNAET